MTVVSPDRLAAVFVELADTLVDDFDVLEFLQLVTARVSELAAATSAGLLLADSRERLQYMAASDERLENLELFQIQADEGPCRDCFHQARTVSAPDLRLAGGRWPEFAPRAAGAGFRSVHAFPLRLRQQVIGSLGLFSPVPGLLSAEDLAVIQALADVATIGLLHERTARRAEEVTAQLQEALASRVTIEQAKGMIAQNLGLTIDGAFLALRTYCRNNHLRLREVASEIVAQRDASVHVGVLTRAQ